LPDERQHQAYRRGYLAQNRVPAYDGAHHTRAGRSLLLHGLSEVTSLELMASPSSDGRVCRMQQPSFSFFTIDFSKLH
jgi:hypothetical protein